MRARITAATACIVLAAATSAAAQENDIDIERFKPAVTHDGFVVTEGSGVREPADPWAFGLFLNYARNPLIVATGDGEVRREIVGGRLGADLMASVTLAEPFAIGLSVPFFLAQSGEGSPSFAGLGDVRIVPKLRLLDDRDSIGLGLVAELRVPTHTGDFSGGARNVVFWPRIVLDHRFAPGLRFGVNAGVAIREGTQYENVEAASELTYAAALGYRFGGIDGKVEIGAEANGGVGLTAADLEETPLEALGYVKINPSDEWEIVAGPGIGALAGYGVPIFRVFAGVKYTPTSHDGDHDGVDDERDLCPDVPEDRDADYDSDGCPEEDADDDQDGVPNADDACPSEKETINGVEDDDGCPDEGEPRVTYEDGELVMRDTIRFQTGSAELEPESKRTLDQVALVLKAHPEVERVRIEGHTDETGTREFNIELSEQRAETVRKYLVRRGVSPGRLETEGYGPDRPIAEGDDEASRAKNRRVEFVVDD
ncbi:OmpA family outer membrane protein [Sorangium cellulosum]|uniref:OmpA family outer membrane protein n=1 Tax=Sorangium cellulosum TaxID=56 RepID=A0A4V0NE51_SORCE|nr:OmpA family protein [Sorangium cellulosum]AUX24952.1 OmpA family outer membrane protein [Sorangium cellulosum]